MSSQALRVLIVDDEAPARNRLKDLLEDCAARLEVEVVGEAANGQLALELLQNCPADVVLLDIRMPGMDGVELAQHLQKLPQPPAVISPPPTMPTPSGPSKSAMDYLLKPIRLGRLFDACRGPAPSRLCARHPAEIGPGSRSTSLWGAGRIHLVPIGEVIYLRAELKYVTVRTAGREYLLEESLTRLEQEFGERFLRVHRNCLVARDYVAGFERSPQEDAEPHWLVLLKDIAEKLPVSRRQAHMVREFAKR